MKSRSAEPRLPRLLVLTSGLMFFYGFLLGGLQLVIADIAADYGAGTAGLGLLVSAQHIAATVAPVCIGMLADRIGKKPVLIVFSAVFGLGCAVAGFSARLGVYVVGACLIGAGYSVCESLSSAALSDLDAERGMQYINLTQCLLSIGAVISPMLIRWCAGALGTNWRLVFYVCAAAFVLLAALLIRTPFPAAAKARAQAGGRKFAFFSSGVFLCLFAAIILYVGLENGFGYFIDSLFDARGQGESLSAYAISAYWAGMAASRFICGLRAYRAGRMLRLCFCAIALLFVPLILLSNGALCVAVSGLIGFAYGPVWTTLVASAAREFPENAAGAIGLMSTGCALGGILYPILTGAIAERFSFQIAFAMLAVTALAGGALCLVLRRK